jgi:hypothetical protein
MARSMSHFSCSDATVFTTFMLFSFFGIGVKSPSLPRLKLLWAALPL